jgi:hypothetical protein
MMRFSLLAFILVILVSVGCTDATPPTPTPTPTPNPNDTTPPTVVSITPADGAKGVKEDASIVITFSEAMDQAATQVAYTSTDLPASAVTFNWNTEGTTLTIKPNDFLDYAVGEDPAKTYALNVTNAAKDAAGNALTPFTSSFSTLRRIKITILTIRGLSGTAFSNNAFITNSFRAGDTLNPISNTIAAARTYITVDLSVIPNGVKSTDIAYAELRVYKIARANDPYSFFGLVRLDHVNYGPTSDNSAGAIFNTPSLASLGVFDDSSKEDSAFIIADVTAAVIDDFSNRAARDNLSQYRLAFPGISTNNDNNSNEVVFLPTDVDVTLLLP